MLTSRRLACLIDRFGTDGDLSGSCSCKDTLNCNCCNSSSTGCCGGLEALAKAAAMCCPAEDGPVPQSCCPPPASSAQETTHSNCCVGAIPLPPLSKRRKRKSSATSPLEDERFKRGPALPPILLPAPLLYDAPPVFPTIPPLSTIASLAGTGCTCGLNCNCPGCVEHRGTEHASQDFQDCPDECGTCVDHQHGIELPTPTGYGSASVGMLSSSSNASFIDAFFARAAAKIPPPPSLRASASAVSFDPMNVTVYPQSLFLGEGKRLDEHGPAFGLVKLPKLECCAGKCGCPGESCGCGRECDGCCSVHEGVADKVEGRDTNEIVDVAKRSCCSAGV